MLQWEATQSNKHTKASLPSMAASLSSELSNVLEEEMVRILPHVFFRLPSEHGQPVERHAVRYWVVLDVSKGTTDTFTHITDPECNYRRYPQASIC